MEKDVYVHVSGRVPEEVANLLAKEKNKSATISEALLRYLTGRQVCPTCEGKGTIVSRKGK